MKKIELSERQKILLITTGISVPLLILGYFGGRGVFGNVIILSVFIVVSPQLIFSYIEYRKLKEVEGRFPSFLRNLTEAIRSEIPFHQAIIYVSRSDYGKLTPYVKKMANQISWGLPVDKVLLQFSDRVKKSKKLTRSIRILIETFKSGGDIAATLDSIADTMLVLKDMEKERSSLLNQHVILMYFICFVFIGIVVGINKLMVPIFQARGLQEAVAEAGIVGLASPCETVFLCQETVERKVSCICIADSLSCLPCKIYFSICSIFAIGEKTSIGCYYTALFFSMSIIVAIFSGLVAGQISENSIIAGIKHSLIMVSISIGTFYILTYLRLLGV